MSNANYKIIIHFPTGNNNMPGDIFLHIKQLRQNWWSRLVSSYIFPVFNNLRSTLTMNINTCLGELRWIFGKQLKDKNCRLSRIVASLCKQPQHKMYNSQAKPTENNPIFFKWVCSFVKRDLTTVNQTN